MTTLPNNQLSKILHERGIRVSWLAEKLGVSRQYVSGLMSGTNTASVKRWQEIANILEIGLGELITGQSNPEQTQVKIGDATITADAATINRIIHTLKKTEPASEDDSDPGPDPGIAELLADEELCQKFSITAQERTALASIRGGAIRNIEQAFAILRVFRL